jgi:hypothetical protein
MLVVVYEFSEAPRVPSPDASTDPHPFIDHDLGKAFFDVPLMRAS